MALVFSSNRIYAYTQTFSLSIFLNNNYYKLFLSFLRHVEELFCYFRHRLSAMQLVKRFVKITFLMDELSGKENELHSLHDVMHSEVEISSKRVYFVVSRRRG